MNHEKLELLKQFLGDGATYVDTQDKADFLEATMKLADEEVYVIEIRKDFIRVELVTEEEED